MWRRGTRERGPSGRCGYTWLLRPAAVAVACGVHFAAGVWRLTTGHLAAAAPAVGALLTAPRSPRVPCACALRVCPCRPTCCAAVDLAFRAHPLLAADARFAGAPQAGMEIRRLQGEYEQLRADLAERRSANNYRMQMFLATVPTTVCLTCAHPLAHRHRPTCSLDSRSAHQHGEMLCVAGCCVLLYTVASSTWSFLLM